MSMNLSNFHTHTLYCDGKDTPREIVLQALRLGCRRLGFSSHGYTETGDPVPYCMTPEKTKQYKAEIRALQAEFRGQIEIYLGVERDYFSADPTDDYEYVIGSVHYVRKDGVFLPVDETKELQKRAVAEHYGGDFYAFIEDYFRLVGDIDRQTHCDIVGHWDLIGKFNEAGDLFDPRHPRFLAASDEAFRRLRGKGLYFEINYGGIARGYRTVPYPDPAMQETILASGEKVIYASDCHVKEKLLFGIEKENDFLPKAAASV